MLEMLHTKYISHSLRKHKVGPDLDIQNNNSGILKEVKTSFISIGCFNSFCSRYSRTEKRHNDITEYCIQND